MAHSIFYPRFFTRSLKTLSPLCDLIHIPFLSFSRHLSFYLSASSVFSSSYIRIRKATEARTLIFLFSRFQFHIPHFSLSSFFLSHDQHVSSSLFLSSPPTERAPRELASLLLRENSACHGEKPVPETRTRIHFLSLPVRRLRSPLLSARVTAFFSSHPVVLRARTLRYRTRPPIFVFFRYSPVRYTCCQ